MLIESGELSPNAARLTACGAGDIVVVGLKGGFKFLYTEPFDFLTWFEFAPEHTTAFNQLLARLRATKEWAYVEREVDIRLVKLA